MLARRYVTHMTRWMRQELLVKTDQHSIFAALAARAVEVRLPPTALPPAVDHDDGRGPVAVLDTGLFGIRLEVPLAALEARPRIAVQTLAATSVDYLAELAKGPNAAGGAARLQGELPFSPVVRIDYPAFEDGLELPELGAAQAPPFRAPLTLVLPHCFDPRDGKESVVMLGAPHGALHWQPIGHRQAAPNERLGDGVELDGHEMRVSIPFAGIFCAFSSTTVEDIAAARIYLFAMPEVPRDDVSCLRVHLCPELPDRIQEMEFAECSNWGLSECVGASQILHLYQGSVYRLHFLDQCVELTWVGIHVSGEFTLPLTWISKHGKPAGASDADQRAVLRGAVKVEVVKGHGGRASVVRAVAKRAGIPEVGYKLDFAVRLKETVRPPAPVLERLERTEFDFTVTWRPPKAAARRRHATTAITHYAIELATTAPSGTVRDRLSLAQPLLGGSP